ncbi:GPR endopeptidase [Cellulosilyticum sp. I15G10I2]|uniref:GPR endopeptidase n=1 Tax=Cellulosilyticum sp. I15G10I2 TaxID=1892843 RepID=UPI00085C02B7|nr:GPR endopeptidase [Cellulosilyticum sp. I15G10I2]
MAGNTSFDNWSPRTDLAVEISNTLKLSKSEDYEIPGVAIDEEYIEAHDIRVTRVGIKNALGEKNMGKPRGEYITIECTNMKENDPETHKEVIDLLSQAITSLLPNKEKKDMDILVIGLGNRFATPDTLGPKVTNKVLVTRHLSMKMPEKIDESVCHLSSFAPGVMGLTGIETTEIISGVAEKTKPDCIIAIDALAARSTSRINSTIQITNTGISPGAGVGNPRKQLNEETVGCPVIAIGVPTVVDTATLVTDAFNQLIDNMLKQAERSELYDMLKELSEQEKYQLIKETLFPEIADLFVTPKEIDEVIEYLTNIIANGINIAVHPGITIDDINKYTH